MGISEVHANMCVAQSKQNILHVNKTKSGKCYFKMSTHVKQLDSNLL